ncbi:hypothetical protein Zmor_001647 [Zophobas morio]|uniref:Uncharacterized protein n=1 Tax=Zophobas morio TaxID=2755281 RepID=A0AA38J9L1_9CUCU|nr:hypothetical protein Zmor_001647 [Zophobas morio]
MHGRGRESFETLLNFLRHPDTHHHPRRGLADYQRRSFKQETKPTAVSIRVGQLTITMSYLIDLVLSQPSHHYVPPLQASSLRRYICTTKYQYVKIGKNVCD